jgi:hypothetical protein
MNLEKPHMAYIDPRRALVALALVLLAGCGGNAATPLTPAAPSPTISAGAPARAGTPSPPAATPTRPPLVLANPSGGSPAAGGGTAAGASIYLWPTYLPAGFQVAPAESRVSGDDQVGSDGLGFYVVTLNNGGSKLVIGGGGIDDALPLTGAEQRITAGERGGRLITSGEQRELILDVPQGKLFVYGSGVSEEELLKVAASLAPIDPQMLRDLAAVR